MRAALQRVILDAAGFDPDTPKSVANLIAWYAADRITGLTDGAAVATWADLSTSGAGDATQASGTVQPTYQTVEVNGLPVVRSDASDDYMTIANTGSILNDATISILAVIKTSSATGSPAIISDWESAGGQKGWFINLRVTTGRLVGQLDADNFVPSTGPNLADGRPHVVSVTFNTATGVFRSDGANQMSNTFAGGATFGASIALIGAISDGGTPAQLWTGDLAEVMVYSRVLNAGEISKLEKYLGEKWGVAVL